MSTLLAELIKKNLVTSQQVADIKRKRTEERRAVQDLLVETGYLSEDDVFENARQVFPGDTIDLDDITIQPHVIDLVPFERAMHYCVLPLWKEDEDTLALAMSDPSDVMALDEIGFSTGLHIKPVLGRQSQILDYVNKCYNGQDTVHDILKNTIDKSVQVELISDEKLTNEEIVDMAKFQADNSSFVRLVNKIICDAIDSRASDIHIEPQANMVEVRYRIDGSLKSIIKIPKDLQPRLSARIKILAKLDIAEQRKAQDGRIKIMVGGRKIDLRISVIPVFYGEKIVLRVLDSESAQFDIDTIGFRPDELDIFKDAIHRPQGVVLVTGPTGSGKTTTLYAALQHIKSETKNIVTIEDPIEYLIEGINQLQLSRFKDVTFATSLRSILRQDPDVILVGEIRDRETADIAFRSALTGHLVFTTLHTNNAVASITRLLDIGLESYLISSAVNLFIAQRLVRVMCPNCMEEYQPDDKLIVRFKNYLDKINVKQFYHGVGCEHCNFTGFFGRTSIFEILRVDDRLKELIYNRASENAIYKQAIESGMNTLAESGVYKVADKITTLEEVMKVTDILEEHPEQKSEFPSL